MEERDVRFLATAIMKGKRRLWLRVWKGVFSVLFPAATANVRENNR
jgi:hypothetical protein